MSPLVSVIMPCFNAGRMLEPALWSVFAQSYPNIELIFVDNNSTDGSAERARSFATGKPRPFRLVHCPDQGANHARNTGYGLARGDYIQWLDADDALGIEKIALQVDALERDRDSAIAYCDWMDSRHLPNGNRRDHVNALGQVDDQILRSLSGVWYPPHSYLVRREAAEILQAERAWFPDARIGTDVEYSAIAAMIGLRFRHVAAARVQYNVWSPTQTSGRRTPYAARVAALRQVWLRLQELAGRPEVAARLTAGHRILLDQDWMVWTMPLGSAEISTLASKRHALRHVVSGRVIEVDSREATVATVMLAMGQSRAFPHHAMLIASAAPSLNHDYPGIISILNRFRREGLLSEVDIAEGMESGTVASPPTRTATALPPHTGTDLPHPQTSRLTRKVVADAWTEVLQGRDPAENERFDAAGGDSFALVNFALSCEASLGVSVPVDALSVRMRPTEIVQVLDRILAENGSGAADGPKVKSELPAIFLVRVRHHLDPSESVLQRACAGIAQIVSIPLPAWPVLTESKYDYPALLDRIVAEIEPRLGEAPVMLFGLCFGGVLAHAVARRLAAGGRRIGFLGILDGNATWELSGISAWLRAIRPVGPQFSGFAPAAAKWLGDRPRVLRWLGANNHMARLPRKFAAELNWHLNTNMPVWFDRGGLARLLKDNGVTDAPVFLFRSLEQPPDTPADLHWRNRYAQVTSVPVLGNHYSLFAPQNLAVLQQALTLAVRQALARSEAPSAKTNGSPLRVKDAANSVRQLA